jgi:hypothetical protein
MNSFNFLFLQEVAGSEWRYWDARTTAQTSTVKPDRNLKLEELGEKGFRLE